MSKKLNLFKSLDKLATEILVAEIMVKDVKTLKESDNVQKAVEMMAKHSIAGLIVCDRKNYPIGIVSEGDILKQVFYKNKNPNNVAISDIMTKELITIKPTHSIGEASVLMKKHNVSKFPVMHNDKIVGYVTKSDLLEKLNEIYYQNRRLMFLTAFVVMQFIVIALMVLAYVKK